MKKFTNIFFLFSFFLIANTGISFADADSIKKHPWYFEVNDIEKCWKRGIMGQGVVVEVWDTKVNFDLLLKNKKYGHKSYIGNCDEKKHTLKGLIHGTAMAGLIAADNGELKCSNRSMYQCDKAWVAGIAPDSKIFNRELINSCGDFSSEDRFQMLGFALKLKEKTDLENSTNAYGENIFITEADVPETKIVLINASFIEGKSGYTEIGQLRSLDNFNNLLIVAGVGNVVEKLRKADMLEPAGLKFLKKFNVLVVGAAHQYTNNTCLAEEPPNNKYKKVEILNFGDSDSDGGAGSAYGKYVDILAPGDKIPSLTNDGKAYVGAGTSEATAIVTGALALMASCNPYATAKQLTQALLNNSGECEHLKEKVKDGRVLNIYKAINTFCPSLKKVEHVQQNHKESYVPVDGTIPIVEGEWHEDL